MTIQRDLALGTYASTIGRSFSFVVESWRALTWKYVLYTFLLCLTWSGVEIAGRIPDLLESTFWALNNVVSMQLNGFAVMLAVLVADRGSPPPSCRWWSYLLAVVSGVVVGSSLAWLVSQQVLAIPSAFQTNASREGYETYVFRHATHRFVVCGLATCVYVFRRLAAHRMAALRVVQLERAKGEKRILESRLAAMQAQVDPGFLRDTLLRVERLYEFDAKAADRLLQEVTKYLRAAIPQTFDPASTVAMEIRLTNAFLNIVGLQSKDRLVPGRGVWSLEEVARMPRMILLPLINHALAHRVERARGNEWFGIDAVVRKDMLVLTICDLGTGFAPDDANDDEIRRIRQRLAGLYGDGVHLTLRETANGTEAELQIPYEVASDASIALGVARVEGADAAGQVQRAP
jgi:hypothetical protein